MTNPKHAQATEQGRYYAHPITGERWPSVTNILDTAINKPALVPWAAKVTDEAWARSLPRAVKLSRRPDAFTEFRKEMKAQVRYVKDTAAGLGSRVHAHAEAHVLGKVIEHDDEVEPYALQLVAFFTAFGVDLARDVEAAEATVINRTHGYAGTGDLWVWLHLAPDGTWTPRKRWLWLLDYKSSATRPVTSIYPESGMQVAALACGEHLLLDDGTELDPPGPIAATAVLNLRVDDYALIPTPTDRTAAFGGFLGALRATTYLHGVTGGKPVVAKPPAVRAAKRSA